MKKRITIAVVGTVVGGLILAVVLKSHDLLAYVAWGVWNFGSWVTGALVTSHLIPGWTIAVVAPLALLSLTVGSIVLVGLLRETIRGAHESPLLNYTEDILDGVKWRWIWSGNRIENLWCFCPNCDAQLVHDEGLSETRFICERCPSDGSLNSRAGRGQIVTTLHGDRQYVLAAAAREILRRIRTGER